MDIMSPRHYTPTAELPGSAQVLTGATRPTDPRNGLRLLAGAVIAVAVLREALGRIDQSPITTGAKNVSRSDMTFASAALAGALYRVGARVLIRG